MTNDLDWLFKKHRVMMFKKIDDCERKNNGCYINNIVRELKMQNLLGLQILTEMKNTGFIILEKKGRMNMIKLTNKGKKILEFIKQMEIVR